MSEQQNSLCELIAAMKANAQSNLELAAAIRQQANAIADLAESVVGQDEDEVPDGFGHLGTL